MTPLALRPSDLPIKQHWPLFLILSLFLLLGVVYSVATPLFEKPDELRHYAYVKFIGDGHGLPLFADNGQALWRQEATQGPLYYVLAALATFWIDDSDFETLIRENPHYLGGQGEWGDNSNRFVHTDREAFPYRGATLAVRVARLIALAVGGVAVVAAYAMARTIFPARPELAAGAAAIVAFNPMFLFIGSSVSNDSTAAATAALVFLAGVRLLCAPSPTRRHFLALGLALGLAALTKSSALALIPVVGLFLVGVSLQERSVRLFLRSSLIVSVVFLALCGWWYASNWAVHGDPLGTVTHAARFGLRSPTPTLLQLLPELEGLEQSFWALFGWRNLPVDRWLYVLFATLDRLALIGWGILLLRQVWQRQWTRRQWIVVVLLWLWFGLALATVLRWMQLSTWGNIGRLLFPGMASVALLLALGWSAFVPQDKARYVIGLLAGGLLIIAAVCPFVYIAPAYARPAPLDEVAIQAIPHRLAATFGRQIELLGHDVSASEVRPGDKVTVTLYWRAVEKMADDYSVFVHLLDENDITVAQRDSYPGRGNFPTSWWTPGEVIADVYWLTLPVTTYAPSTARLEVGLYLLESGQRLPASTGNDNVRFGEVVVAPNPVRFNFGDKIALAGYELDTRVVRPGETVTLTLYWEGLAEMEENYAVFTYIQGKDTAIWARKDSWPLEGDAPTAAWHVGQRVVDPYPLTLDPNTPPGVYNLEIGLYQSQTGERLHRLSDDGFPLDTHIFLSKIRVNPCRESKWCRQIDPKSSLSCPLTMRPKR